MSQSHTTILIVPTGIGAAIGGYAGDALPAARLLSEVTDTLITHPNVLNGALMYWPIRNALYVEGYALDRFAAGHVALNPVPSTSNRLGIILDAGMPHDAILRHKQVADAACATLGLNITHCMITPRPLRVSLGTSTSGASWGTISDPDALLQAAQNLVNHGCQAIAVVSEFPEEDHEQLADYRAGNAVDGIAGAEAVISHIVTRELNIPCAHSPSLPPLPVDESDYQEHPRLRYSAEMSSAKNLISAADVNAVVLPANAFGGPSTLSLAANPDVLIVAVAENTTTLNVDAASVGIDPSRVVVARSYAEAAGFVAANRAGIAIKSLQKYVQPVGVRKVDPAGTQQHRQVHMQTVS
ncbi:hypothetical protein FGB62_76g096 [Gracilaria domingensis]|nr:hypothetical protein FGB62_76g096 [Gracilaria domingensis]